MFTKIWNALDKKGRVATIIGLCFAMPVNAKFLYLFFTGGELTNASLTAMMVYNVIGMVWFILPSKILVKSDKLTIEVED